MNETIGNRIQKYRKQKGLTQEELANALGVSSQAVSKWETDVSCPDISLIPELCHLLGVTSDDIIIGGREEVRLAPVEQRKRFDDLVLRIRIVSEDGDKVNVNLPMSIIQIALEVGVDFVPNVSDGASQSIRQIDFAKVMELAERGVLGKIIDIESADGDTIEVVIE